jgi:hypothetical protein
MKADRFAIRQKLLITLAALLLLPLAAGVATQQAPKPNPYPEHGQVIATRLGAAAVGSAGITEKEPAHVPFSGIALARPHHRQDHPAEQTDLGSATDS